MTKKAFQHDMQRGLGSRKKMRYDCNEEIRKYAVRKLSCMGIRQDSGIN